MQVLFQCLWKRCGEVLSTASGMQRHIRLAHLGCVHGPPAGGGAGWAHAAAPIHPVPGRRQAEPEQSDGEEDFYYTELDSGLEVLTGGLSSLTSMSPTASLPPAFPHLELPEAPTLPSLLRPLALPPPQVLSSAAHPQVCRSDHSYQVGAVTGNSSRKAPWALQRETTAVSPFRAAWHLPSCSRSPAQPGPASQPCPPSLVPA